MYLVIKFFSNSNNPSLEVKPSSFLETSIEVIINDMITPNVQWKAGRSAGAVRMSAIASLGLLIQSNAIKQVQVKLTTIENLLTLLVSVLDDDNKSTRLYVCKIYHVILKHFGALLSKDHLHKLYPEFIKRLDDSSDEIRNEVLNVFSVYMKSLDSDYDSVLYGGHLQFIFENILLYLDDANLEIQVKVFGKSCFVPIWLWLQLNLIIFCFSDRAAKAVGASENRAHAGRDRKG